mmetsp:Transcript_20855/g.29266  ORF Transcript_20855/g.29266 Transcript_20855/m.29266 type:complete len:297 (-) Transcript_20855:9-899(-)
MKMSTANRVLKQMTNEGTTCKANQINNRFKTIMFLRHGQAMHNPRAEVARENGCSHETFLELMRQDDMFDAPLTPIGRSQALTKRKEYTNELQNVKLVVSSPLSRALETADLTLSPHQGDGEEEEEEATHKIDVTDNDTTLSTIIGPKRVCLENVREINGSFMNAKRRSKKELKSSFRCWDFSELTDLDETWTKDMESYDDCAERGYQSLNWLMKREEDVILVISHGGILRYMMTQHPKVFMIDSRSESEKRFGNCELRKYELTCSHQQEVIHAIDNEMPIKTDPIFTLKELKLVT